MENWKVFWEIEDDGHMYHGVEYASGNRVKLPINRDGSIKWFDDNKLIRRDTGEPEE